MAVVMKRSLTAVWFSCVVLACMTLSSAGNETPSSVSRPTIEDMLRLLQKTPTAQFHIIERYAQIRLHNRTGEPPKVQRPLRYFLNCGRSHCNSQLVSSMRELSLMFPKLIGDRVMDQAGANVEIYAMPTDIPFKARDFQVDSALKINGNFSGRISSCRNLIYYNSKGIIEKALIFINSTTPKGYISACLTLEIGRTLGSVGLYKTPLQFMHRRDWIVARSLAILQIYLDQDESLNASSLRETRDAVKEKYFPSANP